MLINNPQVLHITSKNNKLRIIEIFGKKSLNPIKVKIPGDPSSAAFLQHLLF